MLTLKLFNVTISEKPTTTRRKKQFNYTKRPALRLYMKVQSRETVPTAV
jgi:hypothetical protein